MYMLKQWSNCVFLFFFHSSYTFNQIQMGVKHALRKDQNGACISEFKVGISDEISYYISFNLLMHHVRSKVLCNIDSVHWGSPIEISKVKISNG